MRLAEAGGDPPEDSNFCFLELTPIESLFESISSVSAWSATAAADWPPFLLPFLLDGLEAPTPGRAMLGCNRVVVTKLFSTPRIKVLTLSEKLGQVGLGSN